jgi:hypothetical protein
MEDEYLNYFMLHNLAVLYLKRAYAIEDGRDETSKTAAWTEVLQFWFRHVFANATYWNLAQARFVEDAKAVTPFTAQEIESLNQAAKDQYFVNIFIGFVLWYLAAGDEQGVDRHLTLLRQVAEQEDKLKVYFRRLGEKVEKYLRAIDRGNELWNSWEFTIASLDLQVRVAEVLGLDHASAKEQLELYRQTRARYSSPSEYQKAKRQFNTVLLEAIQLGVRGNFTEAGEMIDKVLSTMPPGVDLAKVMDSLRLLREACKNPAAYAERGVNLSMQFEKAYAIVRTINVPKGKADANAKKS